MNKNKVKYVKNPKNISSKLKLFLFSEMQDMKMTSKYIDLLCPEKNNTVSSTEKLNEIIEEALIKEFSPSIKNSPNFSLLVDAVAHNLKKKSLRD